MTGKQIAENLRKNAAKWTRYRYSHEGGMCIIGLKLSELGVPVETWDEDKQGWSVSMLIRSAPGLFVGDEELLTELQQANDRSSSVEDTINYAESNASVDFPLEKLAEALKAQP